MVSKCHFLLKCFRGFRRIADSKCESGNIQDEHFVVSRSKEIMLNGHFQNSRSQHEGVATVQIQDDLNIKYNNEHNCLKHIEYQYILNE